MENSSCTQELKKHTQFGRAYSAWWNDKVYAQFEE
jgi:hypothetical protein